MERQVFYHDTDAGGIVYYANYLKYLEEARTEWLSERGLGVRSFLDRDLLYAVRSCNIIYYSPARYGETICCDAQVEKVTGVKLFFKQQVREKETGRLLAEADVVLACLTKGMKPHPIPEDMRAKMK